MSLDKEELLKYSLELQRQNPGITKAELEKRLLERLGQVEPPAAEPAVEPVVEPVPEAIAPKKPGLTRVLKGWQDRFGSKKLSVAAAVVLLLFVLAFAFGYKEEPLHITISKTFQQMSDGEDTLQSIPLTPEERAAFAQQAKNVIAQEGGNVYLGKLSTDAMNDTDITAVNIRMLEINMAQNPEESWQLIEAYIKHHKLVQDSVLKNATINWGATDVARYHRVKEMYTAADKSIDALYQAYQKKDLPAMRKAIQKVQKTYMLWSSKGGLDKDPKTKKHS